MIQVLVVVLVAGLLAGCGGGGGGGAGNAALSTVGQSSVATPAADSSMGKELATPSKPAEDTSLCTVEIYGDSIMAFNGSTETPAMTLQRIRPNLLVVADHSVLGMSLGDLAPPFPYFTRTAHIVIIENGVIDAWSGKSINTVIYEYYTIIQKVREEGRVPVLTGFSHQALGGPLNYVSLQLRDYYDSVIQAIAVNTRVPFADWGSVPFYGAWDLVDFVHPNKNYSDRLIGRLAMTLDPLTTNCTDILFPSS
ncbi:SGNH/GDSL hydrolase family protein [Variovorax sp. YR216]|uniref:SGNH/GDSL hydrolase family protein n=1 Tax=Variovorax sp. YR216 TaxID=1882828 RepID=UPI00089CA8BE|nr:SGNH/GDSL hydrolase family protein [Variovorax sp. YR216]SEB22508.1 GDSL-like Lipase/Acylhydrolase family protein [Variovorax sp. YR216]